MTIIRTQLLSCIPILCILHGCGQNPSAAMAECESQAYDKIGVHSDSTAELNWLQDKAELVRVCMVKKGFKFKYVGDWANLVEQTSLNVYQAHEMLHTPSKNVPLEVHKEAEDKVARLRPIATTDSANWSK